jgi:CRP-like cAMP-binding protein
LANAEQHAQFRTLETVEQREERRLANTTRNIERRARIAGEDGIQVARLVGLRDIHAPLANPNVQREILGRINQKCVFCGAFF